MKTNFIKISIGSNLKRALKELVILLCENEFESESVDRKKSI